LRYQNQKQQQQQRFLCSVTLLTFTAVWTSIRNHLCKSLVEAWRFTHAHSVGCPVDRNVQFGANLSRLTVRAIFRIHGSVSRWTKHHLLPEKL